MSKISHLILGLFLLSALPVSAEVISITDHVIAYPMMPLALFVQHAACQ